MRVLVLISLVIVAAISGMLIFLGKGSFGLGLVLLSAGGISALVLCFDSLKGGM